LPKQKHSTHLLVGIPLNVDLDQSVRKQRYNDPFTIRQGNDISWRVVLDTRKKLHARTMSFARGLAVDQCVVLVVVLVVGSCCCLPRVRESSLTMLLQWLVWPSIL
jgi:hypothetical protein